MKLHTLALSLVAISCAQIATAQDIAGVALGSSSAAAKAAMLKANGELKLSPLKRRDGSEAGTTAVSPKTTPDGGVPRPVDGFAFLNDSKGNVFFVGRKQRYAPGSRVPEKTLVESLFQKFGKPSHTETMLGTSITWQWDRKGKQYTGPQDKGPCDNIRWGSQFIPNADFSAPESFSPECGKIIQASYERATEGLLPGFLLTALDGKSIYDELNGKEMQAQAEQKKKLDQERSKGTKPQI